MSSLFDLRPTFDGPCLEPEDHDRLGRQWRKVFELMKDGRQRTLREIADATGEPEASVSSRLRDFRKEKFGAHTVERHRVTGGLFMYRLIVR